MIRRAWLAPVATTASLSGMAACGPISAAVSGLFERFRSIPQVLRAD
jgi:hypothetical protein